MIKDIDYDKVAEIIAPIIERKEGEDKQLSLDLRYDEAPASAYYEVLKDVVESLACFRDIIRELPTNVVDAAGMHIEVTYGDSVLGGVIRMKGGVEFVESEKSSN